MALEEAEWPIPIYPATAGLESDKIRAAVRAALDPLTEQDVPDPVPDAGARASVTSRRAGARCAGVHVPQTEDDWRKGQARLRYEEAFVLQAELARRRAHAQREESTARPARSGGLLEAFDARLPFVLTDGQVAAGEQIAADLARPHPMQRLLQGEVGSGKTVVALRAMLQVVDAGGQAALLAPTSVLAAQHVRTLRALLGDLAEGGLLGGSEIGTRVALLTGRAEHGRAAQQPAGGGERAGGDRRRHARAAVGPGAVRGPRARGHRRAAQVRRRAARRGCRPRPRTPRTCWSPPRRRSRARSR